MEFLHTGVARSVHNTCAGIFTSTSVIDGRNRHPNPGTIGTSAPITKGFLLAKQTLNKLRGEKLGKYEMLVVMSDELMSKAVRYFVFSPSGSEVVAR